MTPPPLHSACAFVLALFASAHAAAQPAGPIPKEELQILVSVYREIQTSLVEKPDDRALLVAATKGMVREADPDSGEYFTAAELEVQRQPAAPDAEAIGVQLRYRDHQYQLVPLEGSPAAQAGIASGDRLYAVDGARVKGLEAARVRQLLYGPAGSTVALTVFRESSLSVLTIAVERRAYAVPRVSLSRPAPGMAQLRVPHFNASALQEAAEAIAVAWQAEPFNAMILDLRGCPGGLVESTVGIASMFLPRDTVVMKTSGAGAQAGATYLATPDAYRGASRQDPLENLPPQIRTMALAVLVDADTASGAEIVAAALQDHRRARVFGRPTAGRGSIQTIRPMQKGAIKFTTAYWMSPGGRSIQGNGVAPDQIVADPSAQSTLQAAMASLQK
ncbi:S41 family peptidase [Acidovorax sp. NCPPB 3859]|nr:MULTISPECIES: S41 family peptidase [unclassified Acidovorax]MDA8452051.1 S41 family peptidase [Acidovorax sp. GBBC 3297]MDA8461497.1 S41 family peptidase [Acidovorax sp. GBBC 3333]MDA8466506.1 S41 family peptidase [Acidovorax sp. GBBC 3332]MDA8471542.1 S41 family peptidase [Acidovorax sp. GBBC 3299]WCM76463.1 S41 family peptidase [Acidovorax sp. GBBC 712]